MTFEQQFIQEMRKKFQDPKSRAFLMGLMVEEIRLQLMQERQSCLLMMGMKK